MGFWLSPYQWWLLQLISNSPSPLIVNLILVNNGTKQLSYNILRYIRLMVVFLKKFMYTLLRDPKPWRTSKLEIVSSVIISKNTWKNIHRFMLDSIETLILLWNMSKSKLTTLPIVHQKVIILGFKVLHKTYTALNSVKIYRMVIIYYLWKNKIKL